MLRFQFMWITLIFALFGAGSLPAFAQDWQGPAGLVNEASTLAPGIARGGPHGVDLLWVDPRQHLWWQWRGSAMSGDFAATDMADLSSVDTTLAPALVANGQHSLDAFYRGANGNLWTSWWDGKWWSGGSDLGAAVSGAPVAVSDGLHRIDVLYTNPAGRLVLSHWDGGTWWSGGDIFTMAGPFSAYALSTHGQHKMEVFYVRNQYLFRVWSDGGPWSAEESMGEVVRSNLATTWEGVALPRNPTNRYCDPASSAAKSCNTVAHLFFTQSAAVGDQHNLIELVSSNHSAWTRAAYGHLTTDVLAAITGDELVFVGLQTPTGSGPAGAMRVWR